MEQLYYPLKETFYKKNLIYSFSSNERLNILSKHGINIVNESTNIDRWLNIKSLVNKDILTEKLNIEGLSIEKFNFSIKELSYKEESILYNELKKCERK